MLKIKLMLPSVLLLAGVMSQAADAEIFTNTAAHPVLTKSEKASFTVAKYMTLAGQDRWVPAVSVSGNVSTPYVVGTSSSAPYHSLQTAIDHALKQSDGQQAIVIKVLPGTYQGVAYVPLGAPPLTIVGAGQNAKDVILKFKIDSMITPAEYRQSLATIHSYQPGDPAWYMYQNCAQRSSKVISTLCSAVVWSQSDQFTLSNLTVENALLDATGPGTHQGVALRTDGDKTLLDNVRLIGRQDTFFVNNSDKKNQFDSPRHSRAYIRNSFIEGDVDYVFGRAQAVFDHVTFHSVASRGVHGGYVFAPDTLPASDYGFYVTNSKLTCDSGVPDFSPKLGRAWEQGASHTGYLPGKTANGQLVMTNSTVENCFDITAPWGAAATTNRPFHGNAAMHRDLNDVQHNRLWLYRDTIVKRTH